MRRTMINVASNIAAETKKTSSFLCQINWRYSVKVRGLKLGIVDSLAFRTDQAGRHRPPAPVDYEARQSGLCSLFLIDECRGRNGIRLVWASGQALAPTRYI